MMIVHHVRTPRENTNCARERTELRRLSCLMLAFMRQVERDWRITPFSKELESIELWEPYLNKSGLFQREGVAR